jgi:hypothetical protein
MNGNDLEISTTDTEAAAALSASSSSTNDDELPGDVESSVSPTSPSPARSDLPGARTSWWGKVWGGSYQSVEQQNHADRYTPSSLMPSTSAESLNNGLDAPTTVEDQLRQDCSFFYQGLEDQPSPDRKRNLRPHSGRTPTTMTSRDGAVFYAKYQRLNQELSNPFEQYDHDLALEEEGSSNVEFHSNSSHNVLDVQNSSLFYEQDGKLLMRLPRDQVRLMMDHELEPGIISVEQWRNAEKGYTVSHSESQMEQNPPLRYVMTVPDDLYRRIVSEMSYRLAPPCWGFFKCCHYHEGEHADIRLALAILSVILTFIFIGTMEWETS